MNYVKNILLQKLCIPQNLRVNPTYVSCLHTKICWEFFFYNTAYLFCLLSVVMYTRSDWSRQTDIISQVLGFMALKCPDD